MQRFLPSSNAQTAKDKAIVRISATTEMIVSQTDQVLMVSATDMLKYSFTSQKPPSLTCEKISEPAPVAMASNSGLTPALCSAIGATIPAAVVIATVSEPVARRISAASSHASNSNGTWLRMATRMIALETPLSCNIRPKPAGAHQERYSRSRRNAIIAEAEDCLTREAPHRAKCDEAEERPNQQCHVVVTNQM